jgi:ABC-2 type transport system permease protein
MRRSINAWRAQTKIFLLALLQYPLAMAIWQVGVVLGPVISLVVWSSVARSTGGQVAGYSAQDFADYFLVLMVVYSATFTASMYDIESRIRSGELSGTLLLPVHPIFRDIALTNAAQIQSLAYVVPSAVVLAHVFHAALHPTPWAIVAFAPAVLLAAAVRFLVEWIIGLGAFWVTRLGAVYATYYTALLFFSGQFAPLDLYPAPVRAAAALLPFRWILQFPVELLLGRVSPREALVGFVAQGAWIALSLLLLARVWRAGVRRYSAVGA